MTKTNFSCDDANTVSIAPYETAAGELRIRQLLAETGTGEYVEDDIAIDGGDAEAIMRGPSADGLYQTISPVLRGLKFMHGARITLVYGSLNADVAEKTFAIETEHS